MHKVHSKKYVKQEIFVLFGLISLPVLLHLNLVNLRQYALVETAQLFLLHFILTFFVGLIIFTINFVLKRKSFTDFLICGFFIFFLQFYFTTILEYPIFAPINEIAGWLDSILLIILFLLIFLLMLIFLTKYKKKTMLFLVVFVSLNILQPIFNFSNYLFLISLGTDQKANNKKSKPLENKSIDFEKISIDKSFKPIDIFFIIPDGMINLEKAEKIGVVESKKEFIKSLNDQNFVYKPNFFSNFSNTFISLKGALIGDYPVNENSPKYTNRSNFFPSMMQNLDNKFYKTINKLNLNFFWIGNRWNKCPISSLGYSCSLNYKELNVLFKSDFLKNFFFLYDKSLVLRLFETYEHIFDKQEKGKNFISPYEYFGKKDFLKQKKIIKEKSNFFLIHMLHPHRPYILDKNCNYTKPILPNSSKMKIKLYSHGYKCVLKSILDWDKKMQNYFDERKQIVLIFGDHGWNFKQDVNENTRINERLNNVFFAYKVPEECKNLTPPNSHVNLMRFVLKCVGNSNINYLNDNQYLTYYEKHKEFGNVYKLDP